MGGTGLQIGTPEWWRWLREVRWFFIRCEEQHRIGYHRTPKGWRPLCGARRRDGGACQAPVVWDRQSDRPRNGRCRMHGGLSAGPGTRPVQPDEAEGPRLVPTLEELEARAWAERNAGLAAHTVSIRAARALAALQPATYGERGGERHAGQAQAGGRSDDDGD